MMGREHDNQGKLITTIFSLEDRIRQDRPLRKICGNRRLETFISDADYRDL